MQVLDEDSNQLDKSPHKFKGIDKYAKFVEFEEKYFFNDPQDLNKENVEDDLLEVKGKHIKSAMSMVIKDKDIDSLKGDS